MALSTYALVSLAEAYQEVGGSSGNSTDGRLELSINQASFMIEAYLDRKIVTRGSATWYTRARCHGSELTLPEWPIISVTSIHESDDTPPAYDSTSLLVADTDYQTVAPRVLRRISAGVPYYWNGGSRAVRLVASLGYATTAAVPDIIKRPALTLVALLWRERERGAQGVSSASDAQGNYTRFSAAGLTPALEQMLSTERRLTVGRGAWEQAS